VIVVTDAPSPEAMAAAKLEVAAAVKLQRELNKTVPVRGVRESISLPGRTLETVFYPAEEKGAPVVFAFHGGGFMFGGSALDDDLWHAVRQALRANIVSIDYRKGEENPFPAPLYDAYDAIKYYLDTGTHDFDRRRVAVMGNSAGATESATVSILANRKKEFSIGLQILVYPFVDSVTPPQAKRLDPMELAMYTYFNQAHVGKEDPADPLLSPICASLDDLTGLPRAVIVLAEADGLFDEGDKYADMLRQAGVRVDTMVAEGMPHGFFEFAHRGELEEWCPPAIVAAKADGTLAKQTARTLEFIKKHFEDWAGS
jgi:acetyl esterase/lipase